MGDEGREAKRPGHVGAIFTHFFTRCEMGTQSRVLGKGVTFNFYFKGHPSSHIQRARVEAGRQVKELFSVSR